MALGNNGINYVRSNISRVSTDNSKIKESSETFNYVMNNAEFRKFAEDANLGAEIQKNIQNLNDILLNVIFFQNLSKKYIIIVI